MTNTVATVVSGTAADIVKVSTQNGHVLESGPAGSLLQASAHVLGIISIHFPHTTARCNPTNSMVSFLGPVDIKSGLFVFSVGSADDTHPWIGNPYRHRRPPLQNWWSALACYPLCPLGFLVCLAQQHHFPTASQTADCFSSSERKRCIIGRPQRRQLRW